MECEKTKKRILESEYSCQVKPHSKPWIVNYGGCWGTLIGKRVVLTALHCTTFVGQWVSIGDHDKSTEEEGEQRIKIKK